MEMHNTWVDGRTLIVRPVGMLDTQSSGFFLTLFEQIVGDNPDAHVIVDGSGLTGMTSAGLSALLRVQSRLRREGSDVKLAALPGAIAYVLHVTHLDTLFAMYATPDEARRAFDAA